MTKPLLAILLIASCNATAGPHSPFNKPVSISWWHSSCKDAYIPNPERGYSKGYCDGMMLAYMNELEQWCVPDDVSWGEVQDYVGTTIAEATIKPLSQIDIGDWISNALVVKWPCEVANTSGLATDPELIEKLNAKRDAHNTELTQEEPESQQQVPADKAQEKPAEMAPEKEISRTSETNELAEIDEEKESAEPELLAEAHFSSLASISEFSIWGLRLGLTMEEIHAEWSNRYRKGSKPSTRWFQDCEQRGNVKVCFEGARDGFRVIREKGRYVAITFYEGAVIVVQYDGPVTMRAKFARLAERLGSEHPPSQVSEKQMSWLEGNFMMSITWGKAPRIVMLDAEAYDRSRN